MKTKLILFMLVVIMASCRTSKSGCPGSKYQGPKYKASEFKWY